jgi:hypothetical protein
MVSYREEEHKLQKVMIEKDTVYGELEWVVGTQ